ncbi:family 43 glycosylhydrolase [Propionibacteriaceae bacterium Y1685]|uniref:family 43 glycosylhydrolase n=1 Tax=Microlunatus sp. Y1700 TaxID=3418487 RepID=UPI003B7FD532
MPSPLIEKSRRSTGLTRIGLAGLALAVTAGLALTAPLASAEPDKEQAAAATFHNAVSDPFSDTYADPAVIQGKDGWWYVYATADPLKSGGAFGMMHISRTKDWRDFEYLGTVFDESTRPAWAAPNTLLWAPDVRYVDGQYVMFYTVTNTADSPGEFNFAIGAATAPSPTGPWKPTGEAVVEPRRMENGNWANTIDPAMFTDVDGQHYLYYGGFNGSGWVTKLSADGLVAEGEPTMISFNGRYEGAYVIRKGEWYYLTASSANCCAGQTTGYTVFAGRSKSPMGPFVDAEGTSLNQPTVGGTSVITQNGNRFVGVGHHAFITDSEGRDFIVYHGIDRNKPWLNAPFGINRRPTLIDRIDWVDGWPKARAGRGPSDTDQPSPVIDSELGITPDAPAAAGFKDLVAAEDDQAGAVGRVTGQARTSKAVWAGDARVTLDVKGDQPLRVRLGRTTGADVVVDPVQQELVVTSRGRGRPTVERTSLAASPGWQRLLITAEGGRITAGVSESGLNDESAEVSVAGTPDSGPLTLTGEDVLVDNVSVKRPVDTSAEAAPVPEPGAVINEQDFGSDDLGDWTWVRENPEVTVADGKLHWPVESTDITGSANKAGLLLHDAPSDGDWMVETKFRLDLGTGNRSYQQAGLIVHETDDDMARLGSVAIGESRQTEYGRELEAAPGRLLYGAAMIGTPATEMQMRIAHHRNAAGEHLYRAATSRDGENWTWGATWTFPATAKPRIGIYAHGNQQGAGAPVAEFDYVRFTESSWPADPGAGE